jgi:uncharacterized protein (TIGR02302 family)
MRDRRTAILLAAARLTLAAEAAAGALWPVLAACIAVAALALLGLPARLPAWLHLAVALAALGGLAWLARGAALRLHWPSATDAERRLERDSHLPHRPFATLRDHPAGVTPEAAAIWGRHQARARAAIAHLRLRPPHAALADRDPFALRAGAVLLLAASLVIAGPQAWPRLTGFLVPGLSWSLIAPKPAIQAWLQPPAYTGLPPIFLPEAGGTIAAPTGSRLTLSITGASARPHVLLAGAKLALENLAQDSYQATALLTRPGNLRVGGRFTRWARWTLTLIPNEPPAVAWAKLPGRAGTSLSTALPWQTSQRWGVAALEAELRPQGRPDLPALRIPLPLPGTPRKATGQATPDLSANPYAGLTMTGRLLARDVSGQRGEGAPADFVLPARTFHHPLARAIADVRRRLALHPDRADTAATDLAALAEAPPIPPVPGLSSAGVTLNLAAAAAILADAPSPPAIEQAQARLWTLALALDGALPNAAEAALEAARNDLRRALDDHTHGKLSDRELSKKLDALRQALDKRLAEIARQAMKQGALEKFDPATQHLSSSAMDHAIDRLEKALKEGRMADARQAMDQLSRMMEQLKNAHIMSKEEAQQQQEQQKRGRQQMGALQDMVQRETALLDHAQARAPHALQDPSRGLFPDTPFQDPQSPLQPQTGTQDPSDSLDQAPSPSATPPGAAPPPSQQADARTQRALHRALDALKQGLAQSGRRVPGKLDDAGHAMEDAAGALSHKDDPNARDAVSRAIAALQQGGQAMSKDQQGQGGSAGLQLSLQPGGQSGNGGSGEAEGDEGDGSGHAGRRDPFGRQVDGNGTAADDPGLRVPDEMEQGRSRAIQEELRRRGADRGRPKRELDYIDRLLKPF